MSGGARIEDNNYQLPHRPWPNDDYLASRKQLQDFAAYNKMMLIKVRLRPLLVSSPNPICANTLISKLELTVGWGFR
jgi:hypothetical protein